MAEYMILLFVLHTGADVGLSIYGKNVSYMMPSNILDFDAKNTIGF